MSDDIKKGISFNDDYDEIIEESGQDDPDEDEE